MPRKSVNPAAPATGNEDIVAALLAIEDVPRQTYTFPRFNVAIGFHGLTGKEVYRLKASCTTKLEKRGKTQEIFDDEDFNAGLILAATDDQYKAIWSDQRLLAKYKASGPEEVIKRLLLAGELDGLGDLVLELSGYGAKEVEDVKN